MPKYSEAFLKASKEHVIVNQYVSKLKAVLESEDGIRLRQAVATLEADLTDHFNLEERILFPTALLCLPSLEMADRILGLTREHGVFESDVQAILHVVRSPETDRAIPPELKTRVQDFIDRLDAHARIEMDDLFPKMDRDKRSLAVIRDLLTET
ncbi:MAG TPA: hemerythrin domain-containing protein [bacterium]|nr:hemerythrin domain-containing protein [bacterium]